MQRQPGSAKRSDDDHAPPAGRSRGPVSALGLLDRPPSLSAQVFQQLRDAVVSGELTPGAPVAIEQLAAAFGVSRTPIRESLLALRQLGLIEETAGGFRVTPLDAAYISEVYAVRSVLEGLIVEATAPLLTDADLRLLRKHGVGPDTPPGRRPRAASTGVVQSGNYFHDFIGERSPLTFVNALLDTLRVHRDRLVPIEYGPETEQHKLSQAEHAAILAALEQGNGGLARRLMVKHLDRIGRDVTALARQRQGS